MELNQYNCLVAYNVTDTFNVCYIIFFGEKSLCEGHRDGVNGVAGCGSVITGSKYPAKQVSLPYWKLHNMGIFILLSLK